ncbi:MAG: hypothetical protein Q7V88_17690 [Actinomycetota bacterium]|nr:hypothetical protein [Actinomycetota bacterium]
MNHERPRRRGWAALAGGVLVVLAACGDDSTSAGTTAATTTAAVTTIAGTTIAGTTAAVTTIAGPAATAVGSSGTGSATGKVNINSAGVGELETAFEAAGVTSARRWAREVDEYRPYPSDPEFRKLRQELGKYNIAPDVLELIISTLEF